MLDAQVVLASYSSADKLLTMPVDASRQVTKTESRSES